MDIVKITTTRISTTQHWKITPKNKLGNKIRVTHWKNSKISSQTTDNKL